MKTLAPWPYPRLAAHRGGGRLAPENTLAAMRTGLAHGFRMAEYDVKLSHDDVPVLLHDDTLDRTTDGRGPAAERTHGELARLDAGSWHSAPYAGEPIPTLRAVARYTQANQIASNVEIKPCPGREAVTGARVTQAVRELWHGAATPPLISSFSEAALAESARVAPQLPRALLLEGPLPGDWLARLARHDCIALHMDQRHVDAEVARQVREAGYRLGAWTVNDLARADALRAWQTDLIFTDELALIRPD
ncbi:Glycerophosphoryl diester phosphodiesterase [plant metagenome]|uniref:Glycerophosphoryl diester phosphodiesterase n=1 Tax=plant metagenome TaxID=1297885 RepID=A0A484P644_9ZZZZ